MDSLASEICEYISIDYRMETVVFVGRRGSCHSIKRITAVNIVTADEVYNAVPCSCNVLTVGCCRNCNTNTTDDIASKLSYDDTYALYVNGVYMSLMLYATIFNEQHSTWKYA